MPTSLNEKKKEMIEPFFDAIINRLTSLNEEVDEQFEDASPDYDECNFFAGKGRGILDAIEEIENIFEHFDYNEIIIPE